MVIRWLTKGGQPIIIVKMYTRLKSELHQSLSQIYSMDLILFCSVCYNIKESTKFSLYIFILNLQSNVRFICLDLRLQEISP